jgi:hypothetical protein
MATPTTKPWYTSKTLYGLVIAAAGFFLAKYGVPAAPSDNADFAQIQSYIAAIKAANGSFTSIAGTVLTAIGFLAALYGRIKADTQLTLGK